MASLSVNMGSPAQTPMSLEQLNQVVPSTTNVVGKLILNELANAPRNRFNNCLAGGVAILSIGSAIAASLVSYKYWGLEATVNNLFTRVVALENQDCSLAIENKERECDEHNKALNRAFMDSESKVRTLTEENAQKTNSLHKCKRTSTSLKKEKGEMEDKIQTSTRELTGCQGDLTTSKQKNAELEGDVQSLKKSLNDCTSKSETCLESLQQCKDENEQSGKDTLNLEKEIQTLNQKLTNCQTDNREFYENTQKAVKNADTCIATLTQCANRLKTCEKSKRA